MRARGMFLSLAISAVWLAATSSAGLRPGYERAHRFAGDATGDLDIFTVNPDGSGIVNVTGDPHHDARRIRERAARPAARLPGLANPLLMLFVGPSLVFCSSDGSAGAA